MSEKSQKKPGTSVYTEIRYGPTFWLGLRADLIRTREARFYHCLHEALLRLRGLKIKDLARIFDESERTVSRNVKAGLERRKEPKPGRKAPDYEAYLRKPPVMFDPLWKKKHWTGLMLKKALKKHGIERDIAHCQRAVKRFRER